MTLNLLLFAITFTIFLEIEFDFIFYVPYRSEEISPAIDDWNIPNSFYRVWDTKGHWVVLQRKDLNARKCTMRAHQHSNTYY